MPASGLLIVGSRASTIWDPIPKPPAKKLKFGRYSTPKDTEMLQGLCMEIRVRAFTGTVSANQGQIASPAFCQSYPNVENVVDSTTKVCCQIVCGRRQPFLSFFFVCISCLNFSDKKPLSIGSSVEQRVPLYLG